MKLFHPSRRTLGGLAAVVGALLLGLPAPADAQGFLVPRILGLAFGVGDTPTPTPTPSPIAAGPATCNFPADHPFVSLVLPTGWTATTERGGKLLCAPTDKAAGYSATLTLAGSFSGREKARAYIDLLVKETLAETRMKGTTIHPLQVGKLGSGIECLIQVAEGKVNTLATSYVFMCFAPAEGRYLALVAHGRSDKLNASGFDVVGAMADTIKPL